MDKINWTIGVLQYFQQPLFHCFEFSHLNNVLIILYKFKIQLFSIKELNIGQYVVCLTCFLVFLFQIYVQVLSKKDQQQYWNRSEETYKFVTVDHFCEKFKASQDGQNFAEELSVPYDKSKGHKNALSFNIYSLSKWDLLKACFAREILLMRRNAFIYITKAVQVN